MEVRVLISIDPPSTLSPVERRSEIAAILAAGIVRLKSRAAIPETDQSSELSETCLELPLENVLTVTNTVNDQ